MAEKSPLCPLCTRSLYLEYEESDGQEYVQFRCSNGHYSTEWFKWK